MKEQPIQDLAMDVHQATVVACVRDERGAITIRATVPTEARAILSLVRGAGSRVHVVFEEGTQAQWLHDLLQPHAERVVVCNVRGKSEVSNKSDRINAEHLSELLRVGSLKTVDHGASSVLTLKELVRNYNSLVEDATRVMLRIKTLFRARAIRTPGRSVYSASRRKEWLDQLTSVAARVRAASLLTQLDLVPPPAACGAANDVPLPGSLVYSQSRTGDFFYGARSDQRMAFGRSSRSRLMQRFGLINSPGAVEGLDERRCLELSPWNYVRGAILEIHADHSAFQSDTVAVAFRRRNPLELYARSFVDLRA